MKDNKLNGKRITFRVDEKTRKQGEKVAKKQKTTISDLARSGLELIIIQLN